MRFRIASLAGSPDRPNEDFALASRSVAVVVDGLTARTDTGCIHGVAWFAEQLGRSVLRFGLLSPTDSLRSAIIHTAAQHADTCDLADPATPCAAIAIVQAGNADRLHYLVLGDVSVVLAGDSGMRVVSDQRINGTAQAQRAEADRFPPGSEAKTAALIRMKRVEIAARNTPDGYWIAGTDPAAAEHAVTGDLSLSDLTRVALLSDGATRAVDPFRLLDWTGVLDLMGRGGPSELIARVRAAEQSTDSMARWARNKVSDDATAIYCDNLHERECA